MLPILMSLALTLKLAAALPAPTATTVTKVKRQTFLASAPTLDLLTPDVPQPTSDFAALNGCTPSAFEIAQIDPAYANGYGTNGASVVSSLSATSTLCVCSEGTAFYSQAVNTRGETTQYCSQGTVTTAISTSIPSATPGNALNEGWAQINCDYGSLTSIFNPGADQWRDSGASAAYIDMWTNYTFSTDEIAKTNFTNFVANYFHAKPGWNCQVADNTACGDYISCGQGLSLPNADVSSPAGYMIMNSIASLYTWFDDLWDGINTALGNVTPKIDALVKACSPINQDIEDQRTIKLILDGVMAAIFITAAPMFHSVGSRIPYFRSSGPDANPNNAATAIDIFYGVTGSTFAAIKDAMRAETQTPIDNLIRSYVVDATMSWKAGIEGGLRAIFNDPARLFALIDGGVSFTPNAARSAVSVENSVMKALYASSLNAVWQTGSHPSIPVIVRDLGVAQNGVGCTSYDPSTISGRDGWSVVFDGGIDTANKARVCEGDRAYFLLGVELADPKTTTSVAPGGSVITSNTPGIVRFSSLNGIETFRPTTPGGSTQWSNLTIDDIVFNAVNGWRANGERNGWSGVPTFSSTEDIDNIISGDLKRSRGIVNIPVCSFDDIISVGTSKSTRDSLPPNVWPCPA